jgi:hypothetical protein
MINPKLNKGDRVVLLHMDGEMSVPPGTLGTVKSHTVVFGDDQYSIEWDNGSRLSIISSVDLWDLEDNVKKKPKKINETDEFERNKRLINNVDVFKNFNMKFLKDYLLMVRESSIVNMFAAGPYLYIGKDRIEHEFKYKDISNEEEFNKVLENADRAQAEMINGVIKVLESQNKEVSMENINRYLSKYSNKVLENYIYLF